MKRFLGWFRGNETRTKPTSLPTHHDVLAAQARLYGFIPKTPVTKSICLSEDLGLDVYLKWENKFRTGSFKERGAANFLLSMTDAERSRGVCAASAGNHALALSYYCAKLGVACWLVMPVTAPLVKVEACKKAGAHVLLHGVNLSEAFQRAAEIVRERKLTFIPPYDDNRIIAGQGTCGLEILEQLPDIDSIIVPVGGGGLISGITLAVKESRPDIFILGVRSEWAEQAKYDPTSLSARRTPPSIADGIAVKDIGLITREIISQRVDKMITADESEIAGAIIRHLELEHSLIEGSAAAALVALYRGELPSQYKRPAFVISGSNIDASLLSRLIERHTRLAGRVFTLEVSLPDRPGALHDLSGVVANTGANIIEVHHDRFGVDIPGSADVSLVIEVRNKDHALETTTTVKEAGFDVRTRETPAY